MYGVRYKHGKDLLPLVFSTVQKAGEWITNQTDPDRYQALELQLDPAPRVMLKWLPTKTGRTIDMSRLSAVGHKSTWVVVQDGKEYGLTQDGVDRGSYENFNMAQRVAEGIESS